MKLFTMLLTVVFMQAQASELLCFTDKQVDGWLNGRPVRAKVVYHASVDDSSPERTFFDIAFVTGAYVSEKRFRITSRRTRDERGRIVDKFDPLCDEAYQHCFSLLLPTGWERETDQFVGFLNLKKINGGHPEADKQMTCYLEDNGR